MMMKLNDCRVVKFGTDGKVYVVADITSDSAPPSGLKDGKDVEGLTENHILEPDTVVRLPYSGGLSIFQMDVSGVFQEITA